MTVRDALLVLATPAPSFGDVEAVRDRADTIDLGWLVAHPDGGCTPVCRRCRAFFTVQPAKGIAKYVLRRHAARAHI